MFFVKDYPLLDSISKNNNNNKTKNTIHKFMKKLEKQTKKGKLLIICSFKLFPFFIFSILRKESLKVNNKLLVHSTRLLIQMDSLKFKDFHTHDDLKLNQTTG